MREIADANMPVERREVAQARKQSRSSASSASTTRSRSSRAFPTTASRSTRRGFHRPLPRAARAVDRTLKAFKLTERRRRVLARQRAQRDAAAHLRHRVRDAEGAEATPRIARRGEARDPPALGRELDLFSFHPEAPASPFFHPKGAIIYNELIAYIRRSTTASDIKRS
jgi:threonyl-tRNA synthetase